MIAFIVKLKKKKIVNKKINSDSLIKLSNSVLNLGINCEYLVHPKKCRLVFNQVMLFFAI